MNVSIYIDLPLLLIIISLIYAATRHDRWDKIISEAIHWCIRIIIFLLSIGIILYIISS
ncbi:MAG: hypothetical protein KatS3mg107_0823 [Gemmataceae bacterium]|nr:MAG: hypothetical protein KatS3mg107_0823 [Gemmataceae bacterium]